MEILDIVHRAIQRSQLIPGFNPSECPEDYEERVSDILVHELIPNTNCDRCLDVTEIVLPYKPRRGVIDLQAPPADEHHFIVTLPFSSDYLMQTEGTGWNVRFVNLENALKEIGLTDDTMPRDPTGELIPLGIWTTDLKFLTCPKALPTQYAEAGYEGVQISSIYNVPFTPMRVSGVVEAETGVEVEYKHAMEFVSAEFRHARYVFMDEEYEDKLRVRFHPEYGDAPTLLILPVPITAINYFDSPKPWSGKIKAPLKFREYLISALAFRIADEYGVASAPGCEKAMTRAYNMLVKNYPKRQHAMDVNRRIAETLRRPAGTILSSASFYGGGVNG